MQFPILNLLLALGAFTLAVPVHQNAARDANPKPLAAGTGKFWQNNNIPPAEWRELAMERQRERESPTAPKGTYWKDNKEKTPDEWRKLAVKTERERKERWAKEDEEYFKEQERKEREAMQAKWRAEREKKGKDWKKKKPMRTGSDSDDD